jgi:AcrR family transcriptional regulator
MKILKEETYNRILSAARNEFEQYGYSHSSMRRISATAGMTTGNILALDWT